IRAAPPHPHAIKPNLAIDRHYVTRPEAGGDGLDMSAIDIQVPASDVRCLYLVVARRLAERGYDVALVGVETPGIPAALNRILFLERRILGIRLDCLLEREPANLSPARPEAQLRIDLSGARSQIASPVLKPEFSGCPSLSEA